MGRWPVVAGKKEASAQARAKVFTIHAKLISLAAAGGVDPGLNSTLADAIANARKESVPNDIIDRAIKRWGGLDKDSKQVEEIYYEWYAPGWVGVIIRALTDNKNRTAPNIRHIFSAYGWSMGETGSVSNFLFDYRGIILLNIADKSVDTLEEHIMETSAIDYSILDSQVEIITDKSHFLETKKTLEWFGYEIISAGLGYKAKNYIEVSDFDKALKIYKMLEDFGNDEDVEWVWNNADINNTLWQEVAEHIESHRFRT